MLCVKYCRISRERSEKNEIITDNSCVNKMINKDTSILNENHRNINDQDVLLISKKDTLKNKSNEKSNFRRPINTNDKAQVTQDLRNNYNSILNNWDLEDNYQKDKSHSKPTNIENDKINNDHNDDKDEHFNVNHICNRFVLDDKPIHDSNKLDKYNYPYEDNSSLCISHASDVSHISKNCGSFFGKGKRYFSKHAHNTNNSDSNVFINEKKNKMNKDNYTNNTCSKDSFKLSYHFLNSLKNENYEMRDMSNCSSCENNPAVYNDDMDPNIFDNNFFDGNIFDGNFF